METIDLTKYAKKDNKGRIRLAWKECFRFVDSKAYHRILKSKNCHIMFSLANYNFINPSGVIMLLLIGRLLRSKGLYLWLKLPFGDSPLSFLKSINFASVSSEIFSISNSFLLDSVKASKDNLCDNIRYLSSETFNDILVITDNYIHSDYIKSLFKEFLPGSYHDNVIVPFYNSLRELCENIILHSDTGYGYIIIGPSGPNYISICIGDIGIGFRRRMFAYSSTKLSDFDIIKYALLLRFEGEITGLFDVINFTHNLNGFIKIRSGHAEAHLDLRDITLESNGSIKSYIENNLIKVSVNNPFPGVQYEIEYRKRK